jgi:ATP-binding cassette subfamily C protein
MQREFESHQEPRAVNSSRPFRLREGLRLEGISFRYQADRPEFVIQDAHLHIPARTMVGVVGPSGAGKSTLADLLMGFLTPESGVILLDGRELRGDLLRRWRCCVGYVPQETFLFHDTIRANLLWAKSDATEADMWSALHGAAADQFVRRLPQQLDTIVGDRGATLSGGERQRIALARALLRRPALLLLDEATSHLDRESEARIREALRLLRGEVTIVVISHRTSSIEDADQILVLQGGRVLETSSTRLNSEASPIQPWEGRTGSINRHACGNAGHSRR